MTKCDEIGCPNVKHDPLLERDVCDENWPRPEGCPLNEEESERLEKAETKQESRVAQKLDIVKMLTVFTGHVREETFEALRLDGIANEIGLAVYGKDTCDNEACYGLYIYLDKQAVENTNIPEDLKPLIKLAQDNGCEVLCLDSDGMELDGYMVFDW